MKEITVPFCIGQIVYFKTDEEQRKYFVTGISIRPDGVSFKVSNNGYETDAYDFELTTKEDTLLKLGIDEKQS